MTRAKRQCLYCGRPVLVSKHSFTEGNTTNPVTGAKIETWIAHNACIAEARELKTMQRLVEACGGDFGQARRIRDMLLGIEGSQVLGGDR